MRIELILGVVILPIILSSPKEILYKLLAIGAYALVLTAELLNTSIERLSDRVTKDFDEEVKCVKDIASAAVLIALMFLAACLICLLF